MKRKPNDVYAVATQILGAPDLDFFKLKGYHVVYFIHDQFVLNRLARYNDQGGTLTLNQVENDFRCLGFQREVCGFYKRLPRGHATGVLKIEFKNPDGPIDVLLDLRASEYL